MEIIKKLPDRRGAGRKRIYPFDDLSPGDCLVLNNQSVDDCKRVASALYSHKRRNGLMWWETSVRSDKNTVYVYRIA